MRFTAVEAKPLGLSSRALGGFSVAACRLPVWRACRLPTDAEIPNDEYWATRTWVPAPTAVTSCYPGRRRLKHDPQLLELFRVDRARRAQHQVLHRLRLGEGDDVPDVVGAGEQHHHPVGPEREAAMGWHAVLEGLEQVAEARLDGLVVEAEDLEHALL